MNLIVAVDKNWGIGNDGELLYHIPDDMKFFKKTTLNKVVIMGRKTFESLPGGKPLTQRTNIIMTSDKNYAADTSAISGTSCASDGNVLIYRDLSELFNGLKKYDPEDIFVIGGKSIYELLLKYCSKAYITKINGSKPADTFLTNIDKSDNWKLIYTSEVYKYDDLEYTFNTYQQIQTATYF